MIAVKSAVQFNGKKIKNVTTPGGNYLKSCDDVKKILSIISDIFKVEITAGHLFLSVQQKMELVQVPDKSYGSFYEGDCYILLSVSVGR